MRIKQARLIVNAHKHNLLINSFCGHFVTLLCTAVEEQVAKYTSGFTLVGPPLPLP